MNKQEVIKNIEEIVATAVNHHNFSLTAETKPDEVKGWDSLANAMIITSIENEFGVKFKFSDMMAWQNVGELADIVLVKSEGLKA